MKKNLKHVIFGLFCLFSYYAFPKGTTDYSTKGRLHCGDTLLKDHKMCMSWLTGQCFQIDITKGDTCWTKDGYNVDVESQVFSTVP